MDGYNPFVLLIEKDPAEAALIRQSLAQCGGGAFQLQCVAGTSVALARIGGGGVDVILLDLSLRDSRSRDALAGLLPVQRAAPRVPIIVLYDAHDEGLALQAMRAGAADCVLKEESSDAMTRAICSAVEFVRRQPGSRNPIGFRSRPEGSTISFIGAKGGVGATTVALNVASVLARDSKVILAELRPAFGTLLPYLKPYGQVRNISHLLRTEGAEIEPTEAGACLWPCKYVPGLSVLFGPQSHAECGDLAPGRVKSLVKLLAGLADYVVLDLPAWLSDANRAAAEVSSRLVLVVERDPVCVQSAKLMAQAIGEWDGTPQPIGMILVNRAAPHCPMPLPEIETLLGFPALGVVPPEPDICLGAELAHTPLIAFQPDSMVADSLITLAEKCASDLRAFPHAGLTPRSELNTQRQEGQRAHSQIRGCVLPA
ncbi:MAG: response regulator [Bryobacteraceae bacterium]|jgi:pilus assembly protein CpaE